MTKLILLRHGESIWNQRNLFTGWVDVPLSEKGIHEAQEAGALLASMPIDIIFCSTLIRSIETAMIVMARHKGGKTPIIIHSHGKLHEWGKIHSEKALHDTIPVYVHDALNERMYGDLQGLNKRETMDKFGEEQVKIWRRSYRTAPPNGESLAITTERTLPYFDSKIISTLKSGKNVFVSAHGNSLRAIIKEIDNLSEDEIVNLELATGKPIIYEYDHGKFKKI